MPIFDRPALAHAALIAAMAPSDQASVAQPPADTGIGLAPYLALAGGNAADAVTTWQALASGRGQEGNPALPGNPAVIAALKAGLTPLELLAVKRLAASGHPTWAKVMGYGIGALGGGVALHNATVGR